MYIVKVLLVFMVTSVCLADELQVKAFNIQYRLEYSNDLVKLKGNQIDVVIKKKKCNQRLIKDFNRRLSKKLNSTLKRTTEQKYDFNYIIDSQAYYENKKSLFGTFLIKLPNSIKKVSIQNSILCGTKQR